MEDSTAAVVAPPAPDVPTSLRALGQAFMMLGQAIMNIPSGEYPEKGGKKIKKEKSERKPRQVSAYNLFVKESSQTLRDTGKYATQKEVMQALGHAWKSLTPAGKAVWDGKAKALLSSGLDMPDVEEETEEEAPPSSSTGKRKSVEPPKKAEEEPEEPPSEKKKKRKSKGSDSPAPIVEVAATPVPASDKKKKKKAKA